MPAFSPRGPATAALDTACATNSVAAGPGLDEAIAGAVCSFTVLVKDKAGNKRVRGGDIVVARLVEPKSGRIAAEGHVTDNTDGSYYCSYVPTKHEPNLVLRVSVNGMRLKGSPFRPVFQAGPVAGRCCTVSGVGLHDGVTGRSLEFKLQARDGFGNPRTSGGDRFQLAVLLFKPANEEAKVQPSAAKPFKVVARDDGDGTYTFTWSAAVPGQYDLAVTMEHAPIRGSPFRCNVASGFVRPPKELTLRPSESEGEGPSATLGCNAALVEGQLLVLGSKLPTATSTIWRPSSHLCQFQLDGSADYLKGKAPESRWRSCLLRDELPGKLTLVAGPAAAIVVSQSGGDGTPIDGVSVADVPVGSDTTAPTHLAPVSVKGAMPAAVDGFALAYTAPPVTPAKAEAAAASEAPPPDAAAEDDAAAQPAAAAAPPPPDAGAEAKPGVGGGLLGGQVWLFGGEGMEKGSLSSTLSVLDLSTTALVLLPGGGAGAGAGFHMWQDVACVAEEFDAPPPREDAPMAPVPVFSARRGAALAVDTSHGGPGSKLWLMGGRAAAGVVGDLFCLEMHGWASAGDEAPLTWRAPVTSGRPPAAREQHTLTCGLHRFLVAVGGLGLEGTPIAEVAIFDLPTLTWSVSAPPANFKGPSLKRFGHSAGYSCGGLYVFGGSDGRAPLDSLVQLRCDKFIQKAALLFNGDNSKFVQVKGSPSLQRLSNVFSLEAWVLPTAFPNGAPAACKADAGFKAGFGLFSLDEATAKKAAPDAEKLPNMSWWVAGCPARAMIRLELHEWSHLVGTWDGACLYLYHNGVLADSVPYALPNVEEAEALHTKGDFFVGGLPGKVAWEGQIDEVCLTAECVDQDKVRATMNSEVRSTVTEKGKEDPVLGHWTFNEGAGDDSTDASANKNHATLEGGVPRVLSTREFMKPALSESEKHVDAAFMELKQWKVEFEAREGRLPTRADFLLADKRILGLARRMGELD